MADRSVRVVLSASVAGFEGAMRRAAASTKTLTSEIQAQSGNIDRVSSAATRGGMVIGAGLAAAAKAAIDWESAWTGVTKTVDATANTSLPQLEEGLRGLARELPASHEEIAGVAEAAGQLGVSADDVVSFTRTMIDLGETTNLTAEGAATDLARFANITGTATSDVGRLGSALVGLGNSYATTEAEILGMSMRLSGVGVQIGLSEGEIFGLATALSSVGIEAQAGGTAMTMGIKKIDAAVRNGSDSLELFASTAGMSSDEFSAAWGSDASGTLAAFIEGLGKAGESGESVTQILSDLGIEGIREADAFVRLAQAGDLAGSAMKRGAEEFSANTALVAEAEKRYSTTASQVQVAWNRIKDAAIDAGQYILPVVASIAEGAATVAEVFGRLPGPVQASIVGLAGVAAAGLLGVGAFGRLAVSGIETVSALRSIVRGAPTVVATLKSAGKGAVSAAGGFKRAAIGAAALTVALVALAALQEQNRASFDRMITKSDEMAASLKRSASEGVGALNEAFTVETQGLFSGVTKEVDGLGEALQRVLNPTFGQGFEDALNGFLLGGSAASQMTTQFQELDTALAGMASGGNLEAASQAFEQVKAAADEQGVSMEQLATLFPQYSSALRESGGASAETVGGVDLLTGALDEQAAAAKDVAASTMEMASAQLAAAGSLSGLEAAIDAATDSAKEHGKTLDIDTEAGRQNEAALRQIASASLKLTDAQMKSQASAEEVTASQKRARDAFLASATQMGMTTAEAVDLAAKYGLIPSDVATAITAPGAKVSKAEAVAVMDALTAIPGLTEGAILAPGARPSKSEVDAFISSVGKVPGVTTTQLRTAADLYGVSAAKRAIASVRGKTVTVRVRTVGGGNAPRAVADGGLFTSSAMVQRFADGGFPAIGQQQSQIRAAGGRGIMWAEEGAGPWEAFISGAAHKRGRSRRIAEQVVAMLGGVASWERYADGGVRQAAPVRWSPPSRTSAFSSISPVKIDAAQIAEAVRSAFPSTQIVVDADGGLVGRMRVEAQRVVGATLDMARGGAI